MLARPIQLGLLTATLLLASPTADAAFINFDDRNPNTITITAGDFEGGFSVNGTQITSGLGNSASVTLADGTVWSFSGSWIDLGQSSGSQQIHFELPSAPGFITSGMDASASTDGSFGTINGTFEGFTGTPYFFNLTPPRDPQNGPGVDRTFPFLSIHFDPEVPTPEPASMLIFGAVAPGLVVAYRRRAAKKV